MRLTHVRVQNYRCVRDTGWFEVEQAKTILVGPNEAGKTAVLEALQQINPDSPPKIVGMAFVGLQQVWGVNRGVDRTLRGVSERIGNG